MSMIYLSEKTKIPIGWVFALLVGCAGFTGTAISLGTYFGGRDANAAALAARLSDAEQRLTVLERVELRLGRIEGKLGIFNPPEDSLRAPANK